ncbi:MAG: FAD-binding domain-containing protein [Nitrospira sp.]|nr:FAD-binding domain-containing protein [Nitrospira sp.]
MFAAWSQGLTGYPIVDAGMRQLNQTGWMHNRVRMVVASFLVKDLRIDWQSGERYFMERLVDGDLAANNGNWQWCASTGTDAMQGYRIFNPRIQSEKFDAEGDIFAAMSRNSSTCPRNGFMSRISCRRWNRCRPDAASDRIIRSRSWTIGKRARNIWISERGR